MLTTAGLSIDAAMPGLPDPLLAWEDLSAVDRRALTEILVDKIIIERHPRARSTRTAGATTSSAPSPTKILSKGLSGSSRCTRLGSRSSPGLSSRSVTEAKRNLNCAQLRSSSWVHAIARIAFSGERSRPVET
jgi:hypothetical protein